jgi:rubrerythrin
MTQTLGELLREAVKLEEDGRKYYLDVARRTQNPLVRRTFEALASDEGKHRSYIEAYYRAQERREGWPSMEEVGVERITAAERARNVFEEAARHADESITEETHLEEAYAHAVELERKSIAFYQEMLEAAIKGFAGEGEPRASCVCRCNCSRPSAPEPSHLEEFLEFLIGQEREHLKLLSRTQDYIRDPATWFFDEEKWSVEG